MSRLMTKPTKWPVRPAKTQISLGTRPVWSESSLSAWRMGSLATHCAHSEGSDQTWRMPRLIWVFAGRTCHFVGFVMRRLKYFNVSSAPTNCVDKVSQCSNQVYRDAICQDDHNAILFCQKSCGKCRKPILRLAVHQVTLNKEVLTLSHDFGAL